jgi:hypothetical protein
VSDRERSVRRASLAWAAVAAALLGPLAFVVAVVLVDYFQTPSGTPPGPPTSAAPSVTLTPTAPPTEIPTETPSATPTETPSQQPTVTISVQPNEPQRLRIEVVAVPPEGGRESGWTDTATATVTLFTAAVAFATAYVSYRAGARKQHALDTPSPPGTGSHLGPREPTPPSTS